MPIITLDKDTLNIDGTPIQDLKQEEIVNIAGSSSYEDTRLISRCLSAIQGAYNLKERNGSDRYGLDYLSQEYPEHDHVWNKFKNDVQSINYELDNLDVNSFASRIFNVEKSTEIEISDMAADYIVNTPLAESVLKTNMRTGIINLTSVEQVREDVLEEIKEIVDNFNSRYNQIFYDIDDYREAHDLYEEYDEDYEEYDEDYDDYDDYDEYDEYDDDLNFDDENDEYGEHNTYTPQPTSSPGIIIFTMENDNDSLEDNDPWSDD